MKKVTLQKKLPLQLITVEPDLKAMSVRNYDLTFTINTAIDSDFDGDAVLQAQFEQNTSFTNIACMVETAIHNSIMFDMGAIDDYYLKFNDFENNFLILPDSSDLTLCAALHCKFNSITTELTTVHSVKLEDKDDGLCYEYSCDSFEEGYSDLPALGDWIGELSYFDQSWWFRNDITTYDRNAKDADELEKWKLEYKQNGGEEANSRVFKDIRNSMSEVFFGKPPTEVKKSGEIIEIDFKNKG